MDESKATSRVSMKMPQELRELLKAEAERQRRSLHNLMLNVLWDFAESTKKNQENKS